MATLAPPPLGPNKAPPLDNPTSTPQPPKKSRLSLGTSTSQIWGMSSRGLGNAPQTMPVSGMSMRAAPSTRFLEQDANELELMQLIKNMDGEGEGRRTPTSSNSCKKTWTAERAKVGGRQRARTHAKEHGRRRGRG